MPIISTPSLELGLAAGQALPLAALASCPNCALARDARREFWSEQPEYYAAILLLPFLVVLLASRFVARLQRLEAPDERA